MNSKPRIRPSPEICTRSGNDSGLANATLREASLLLRQKLASPVELATACLNRIEELDGKLRAFITVDRKGALEQAHAAEKEIRRGEWRGPLHGIPIAIKDLIDVQGLPTTAASRVFGDASPAQHDAEAVRRLRAAGAILIGKTNLHEFAYGASSVVSAYGPVANPWMPDRTAGGSSSGSAVAVATGMCCAALGTDTAGSIRLPSAYCGVVGLKPTYGLVSTDGVVPLAWTFDYVGPIARTSEDAALVLAAISGQEAAQSGNKEVAPDDWQSILEIDVSTLRLGIVREYFFADLHPEIAACTEEAVAVLQKAMAGSREIEIPIDIDRTVHNAEAWTYHQEHVGRTPELYHPETLKRIRNGVSIAAADYIRALRHVQHLRRYASDVFREVDVLITPAVAVEPPTIAELTADMEQLRSHEMRMLRNTRPFNVLGWPALVVPCGTMSSGAPIGIQLAAAPGKEALLLALANTFERSQYGEELPISPKTTILPPSGG